MSGLLLELADSEVAAVQVEGELLWVRFSAAQVSHPDPMGAGRAFSHLAGLELRCHGGPWPPLDRDWVGRLASGELLCEGRAWTRLPLPDPLAGPLPPLPFPLGSAASARLEMRFANGAMLSVRVEALSFALGPDSRLTESLAC